MAKEKLWFLKMDPKLRGSKREHFETNCFYDYYETPKFVVRAESEKKAREIAQRKTNADYKKAGLGVRKGDERVWLDPDYTVCEPLKAGGKPGVILLATE